MNQRIEALYFPGEMGPLFGIHHAPPIGQRREHGVVLCPAIAGEYLASYRAFRLLAEDLAQRGFDTFRFDYYGCGDSAGSLDETSLMGWKTDVLSAADFLQSKTESQRLSLLGLRLGAALAIKAATEAGTVESLILWSPVIWGEDQLAAVQAHQRQWYRGIQEASGVAPQDVQIPHSLELPLSASVVNELRSLKFTSVDRHVPGRKLVVAEEGVMPAGFNPDDFLGGAAFSTTSEAPVWQRASELGRQPAPVQLLRIIAEWLITPS